MLLIGLYVTPKKEAEIWYSVEYYQMYKDSPAIEVLYLGPGMIQPGYIPGKMVEVFYDEKAKKAIEIQDFFVSKNRDGKIGDLSTIPFGEIYSKRRFKLTAIKSGNETIPLIVEMTGFKLD